MIKSILNRGTHGVVIAHDVSHTHTDSLTYIYLSILNRGTHGVVIVFLSHPHTHTFTHSLITHL